MLNSDHARDRTEERPNLRLVRDDDRTPTRLPRRVRLTQTFLKVVALDWPFEDSSIYWP
jgi:hypothetical protein